MSAGRTPKTTPPVTRPGSATTEVKSNGPLQRQKRSTSNRVTSEKKIADDEFMAASIGDVEWLKQSLRDVGKQLNFDKNGLTAVHLAAIHGRLECLKLCIDKLKFDVNIPSSTGWRPIHLAISNQTGKRSMQCLTYLLEKNPDVSVCNDDGITPAHQAASEGHVQCLKLLIEKGASICARDCRGNTPLDLAKLWGHKKCARILAAETWYQDKNHVAKEMTYLKRVKMQHVLQEIENEEEFRMIRDARGDEAFHQWLDDRKLEEKPTGPQSKKDQQQGLYKANSKQPDDMPKIRVAVKQKSSTPTSASSWKRDTFSSVLSEDIFQELHPGENKPEPEETTTPVITVRTPVKVSQYTQSKPWMKYKKVDEKDYISNLTDLYPRDEYTMMPKLKCAPKYYTGKFDPVLPLSDHDELDQSLTKKNQHTPDLPSEVIKKMMAKDPSCTERPMVFKAQHIYDIHTKRKYDVEFLPPSEIPFHLSSDLKSFLVMKNLKVPLDNAEYSDRSMRSDHDLFPQQMVVQAFKQMSKPDHFPNIRGPEYEMNFGDIKGVF